MLDACKTEALPLSWTVHIFLSFPRARLGGAGNRLQVVRLPAEHSQLLSAAERSQLSRAVQRQTAVHPAAAPNQ